MYVVTTENARSCQMGSTGAGRTRGDTDDDFAFLPVHMNPPRCSLMSICLSFDQRASVTSFSIAVVECETRPLYSTSCVSCERHVYVGVWSSCCSEFVVALLYHVARAMRRSPDRVRRSSLLIYDYDRLWIGKVYSKLFE